MARTLAIALAIGLLVAPPARAGTQMVRLGWDEMRTVVDHADPRRMVRVWVGAGGQERIKGRLAGITNAGLRIEKRQGSVSVRRGDIHSVKLFPRRTHNRGNRRAVAILSGPIVIGAFFGTMLSSVLVGGYPESPGAVWGVYHVGAMFAVPWAIWRLARRADRGSILIILDKGPAD